MGRFRVRWGAFAAVALCTASLGCSTNDEIVATQRSTTLQGPDGAIYLPTPTTLPCEPGSYSGVLFAIPGDGGIKIQYSGRLNFSITQSRSGEFLVTDSTAQLSGMGDDGTKFQAEIMMGSCKDGIVQADLVKGEYTYFTNLDKTATGTFDFTGSIQGHYDDVYAAFVGSWTTALHIGGNYGDLIVTGKWQASRTTP